MLPAEYPTEPIWLAELMSHLEATPLGRFCVTGLPPTVRDRLSFDDQASAPGALMAVEMIVAHYLSYTAATGARLACYDDDEILLTADAVRLELAMATLEAARLCRVAREESALVSRLLTLMLEDRR